MCCIIEKKLCRGIKKGTKRVFFVASLHICIIEIHTQMLNNILVHDFKAMSTPELISVMADKDKDEHKAGRAFSEFHHRFMNFIYIICANHTGLKAFAEEHEKQEIANNAILDAYYGAATYKADSERPTDKNPDVRVKAWLATITRNAILKYFREYNKLFLLEEKEEQENEHAPKKVEKLYVTKVEVNEILEDRPYQEDGPSPPTAMQRALRKELKNLKDRDKDILITCLEFEDENGILPSIIRERMCKKHHITEKYRQKIKERTIDKLINNLKQIEKSTDYESKIKKKGRRKVRERTESDPARHGGDDPGDAEAG